MSKPGTGPLTDDELARLSLRLIGTAGDPFLLVAVSGGADSMALMHLTAEAVRRAGRGRVLAATVDHGLRPDSAAEARFVETEARKAGIPHVTLRWEGPRPPTGIQEAARAARYGLLAGVYHARSSHDTVQDKRLLTAHTLDDQAETVLMRLARGSGVEGMSGIPPMDWMVVDGSTGTARIKVQRPLLGIAKSRLIATLEARGLSWMEDPSNDDTRFERVRIRQALPELARLGITADAVTRSARRLRSVREALDQLTQTALCDPQRVRIDPLGFADIDRACWTSDQPLPEAIRLRVLAAVIRAIGGLVAPLSLQSLEGVADELDRGLSQRAPPSFAATLGRTRLTLTASSLRIVREVGRFLPPPIPVAAGAAMVWDNRFDVRVDADAPEGLCLKALGSAGRAALKAEGDCPPGIDPDVLEALPSFWMADGLVAVPALAAAWTQIASSGSCSGVQTAEAGLRAARLKRFATTVFLDRTQEHNAVSDAD